MQYKQILNGLLFLVLALTSGFLFAATGDGINLECDSAATALTEQLSRDGLLITAPGAQGRARDIAHALCAQAQTSAIAQHQAQKQRALDNWFVEYSADKAGNRRLKNKR